MAKVISFKVKLSVDGKEQLTTATADVKDMKKALAEAGETAGRTRRTLMDFASVTTALQGAMSAISGLQHSVQALSGAFYKSQEQQTKMVTVMRERMTATDGEIASVNSLIAAQTELGVLGGTVQRAGAQQLATFLSTTAALRTLIPAMNDLVVQQRGIAASATDAQSVGNLMGKAMQGNTTALRRVGIVFSEAQAEVLKFGTEEERAATLAQVITENVGHMNEAMGKTAAGNMAQIGNQFAAIKVRMGEVLSQIDPYLTAATQTLGVVLMALQVQLSTSSLVKWARGLSLATLATKAQSAALSVLKAAAAAWNTVARFVTGQNTALSASAYGAAAGLSTLKMAFRALMVTTGVGIIIAAATMAVEALMAALDKSPDSAKKFGDGLTEAQRVARETSQTMEQTTSQAYGSMRAQYEKLRQAWARLSSEQQKAAWIRENGQALRDLGLSVESVADAEGVFVSNTDKVEQAFRRRAKAAAAQAALTKLYEKQIQLEGRIEGRNDAATKRNAGRKAVKAGDVVQGSDSFQREIAAQGGNSQTVETGTETSIAGYTIAHGGSNVRNEQVWTEQGAAQYNATAVGRKWKSVSAAQKADEKALEEVMREQERIGGMAAKLAQEEQKANPKKGTAGSKGGKDTPAPKVNAAEAETPLPEGSIAALNKRMQELRGEQELATDPARYQALQQEIDRCGEDVKRLRGELETPYTPPEISEIGTLRELEEALRHYGDLQRGQSADEAEATQRTIDALERKREAMQRATEIPAMQRAAAELAALTGKERTIKIRAIGLDGINEEIAKLRAMLADTENPVTDSQRKEIEELIQTYKGFRKETTDTFDELQKGWGGVEAVGNGIKSMADTLEGDASAWEKLCAVVDGFIQICEGFETVSAAVQALTQSTEENTGATLANAGAKGVKAAVEATDAVATEVDAESTGQNTEEQTKNAAATGTAAVAKGIKTGMETADAIASGVSAAATASETIATEAGAKADATKAITEVSKQGAKEKWPMNLIAIATGVAAVVGALALMGSFSKGGVVGGSSPTGDRLLARVNSGEMILNKAQQRKLLEMLNGTRRAQYAASSAAVTTATGAGGAVELDTDGLRTALRGGAVEVEMKDVRLRGSDLYLSMKRYERKLERN